MNATEKQAALKRCDVLDTAADDAVEWLSENVDVEYFEPGQVVFDAGEESTRVYVVAAGALEARLSEKSEIVSIFEPGSLFGEYAMLTNGVRIARVVAQTDCILLSVDDEHFRTFLLRSPESMMILLRTAVRRLQRAERNRS